MGHREGSLTLVPYDAMGVRDTLRGLEAGHYLAEKGAFLTAEADAPDPVVLCRGNGSQGHVVPAAPPADRP